MNSDFKPQFIREKKFSKAVSAREIKSFPNVNKIANLQDLSQDNSFKRKAKSRHSKSSNVNFNQNKETQHHCVICSGVLLRQITNSIRHWYCPRCHENLSDDLIFAIDRIKSSSKDMVRYFRNPSRNIKVIQFQDQTFGIQERVVFPGQTVFLNPKSGTCISVCSGEQVTCLLSDTIPCEQLPMAELGYPEPSPT